MMKMTYTTKLCSFGLLASVSFASQATALSIEEVMAKSSDPAVLGLEISKEADVRDLGYGSAEVDSKMTLRNSQGQESVREMRQMIFEMQDESVGDKSIIIFDKPHDVKGTAFLTHSNILTPDKQWMYLPERKLKKRINSKNKSGPFMGSEFAYEDIASQEVAKYTYKYLRTETCPTDVALQCVVVERVPQYKYSGYTKQIGWVDTAEFRPQQIEFYDLKSDLMKTLKYLDYKHYKGKFWRAHTLDMVNHQNGKGTVLTFGDYNFDVSLDESDFTKAKLDRVK